MRLVEFSTSIVKFAQDVAENSGARFRAATVRERSAASTRGTRRRARSPVLVAAGPG